MSTRLFIETRPDDWLASELIGAGVEHAGRAWDLRMAADGLPMEERAVFGSVISAVAGLGDGENVVTLAEVFLHDGADGQGEAVEMVTHWSYPAGSPLAGAVLTPKVIQIRADAFVCGVVETEFEGGAVIRLVQRLFAGDFWRTGR